MSCFSEPHTHSKNKIEVKLDLSNYDTKSDLKTATGVDTSDLASLKSDIDELNIDNLKNVRSNLSNLKNEVDKLDVDKLVPVSVDLSKLNDLAKNNVVKKTEYDELIKIVDVVKTTDAGNLVKKTGYDSKIGEIEE